jgi:hypothetical protein
LEATARPATVKTFALNSEKAGLVPSGFVARSATQPALSALVALTSSMLSV